MDEIKILKNTIQTRNKKYQLFMMIRLLIYSVIKTYNMKIPSKQELQQIAFNHLSDNDFNDFMNLYKKCTTAKPYFFSD